MGHTVGCMRLTRRNALIGLGTVAAGAGVIGGTGAFTSVDAERSVSVQTTGDASAALTLEQAPGDIDNNTPTANAAEYVTTTGDDLITIDISSDGNSQADGINMNARTTLENLITITNNGTQTVNDLILEFPSDGNPTGNINISDTFHFTTNDTELQNNSDILEEYDNNPLDDGLGVGETVTFGIVIDLIDGGDNPGGNNSDLPDTEYTLSITANTSDTVTN